MPQKKTRLEELQERLGLTFENRKSLKLALMHRSFVHERNNVRASNERLEFLGDAVLSVIVANYLYQTFPDRPEGELTDLRSALVRRETLAKWAAKFELGQYLYLGKGLSLHGGRNQSLILASAFEAVLGALFLERGLERATAWLIPQVVPELTDILAEGRHLDYKGLLQKAVQHRLFPDPSYVIVAESGPEHERLYEIEARTGEQTLGRGSGLTKQLAQQAAARAALSTLENLASDTTPDDIPVL